MPTKSAIAVIMQFLVALNDGDEPAALALLHDDPSFLDADGNSIAGEAACAAFVKRLCEYAERYRFDVHSVALERDAFLIDGQLNADETEFSGRLFARILMDGGKVRQFQRFHGSGMPSLANALAPELINRTDGVETVH